MTCQYQLYMPSTINVYIQDIVLPETYFGLQPLTVVKVQFM